MSEPTYRIAIEHRPEEARPYVAGIYRVADGSYVTSVSAGDREDAILRAQNEVASRAARRMDGEVFLAEDGEIVPAPEPQSRRA